MRNNGSRQRASETNINILLAILAAVLLGICTASIAGQLHATQDSQKTEYAGDK